MNSDKKNNQAASSQTEHNDKVIVLLNDLHKILRLHKLWQPNAPDAKKLESTLPFCYDTLAFEEWLQFIFIPKITLMINEGLSLPTSISLTPMATEAFKEKGDITADLLTVIASIDEVFSQPMIRKGQ
jgi:uncharacterized protein YqcC (DUF446 family)